MTDATVLQSLSFHDTSISSLQVDFEARSLTIVLAVYNESASDYNCQTLTFSGIDQLSANFIAAKLQPQSDLEIYGHEITHLNGAKRVIFTIRTASNQPSAELAFCFEEFVMTRA